MHTLDSHRSQGKTCLWRIVFYCCCCPLLCISVQTWFQCDIFISTCSVHWPWSPLHEEPSLCALPSLPWRTCSMQSLFGQRWHADTVGCEHCFWSLLCFSLAYCQHLLQFCLIFLIDKCFIYQPWIMRDSPLDGLPLQLFSPSNQVDNVLYINCVTKQLALWGKNGPDW